MCRMEKEYFQKTQESDAGGALVTVIVPCYNSEKYIRECVESVITQTIGIEKLEILFVDDGSADRTVEILKEYEEKYPNQIGIICCEKNGRQGTARNIGLQYSTGKYVSFVDSDDWIRRDMYERLVTIAEDTKSDIVQFRYEGKKEYEKIDRDIGVAEYKVYEFDSEEKRRDMLIRSDILNESCTQKLYLRALLIESGVQYAEGVSYEEPLFTYPLKFFVKKAAVLNQALYYYRYNEEGTTAKYMSNVSTIFEHLQVQEQTYEFVMNLKQAEAYKSEIELYFLHTFFVEPFYFFKYRGYDIPVRLFDWMCKEVKRIVPAYGTNRYLAGAQMQEEKALIDLIGLLDGKTDDEKQRAIKEKGNQLST